jgi:hypothetical protein
MSWRVLVDNGFQLPQDKLRLRVRPGFNHGFNAAYSPSVAPTKRLTGHNTALHVERDCMTGTAAERTAYNAMMRCAQITVTWSCVRSGTPAVCSV